jgi:hypothetical protein
MGRTYYLNFDFILNLSNIAPKFCAVALLVVVDLQTLFCAEVTDMFMIYPRHIKLLTHEGHTEIVNVSGWSYFLLITNGLVLLAFVNKIGAVVDK